MLRFVLFVLLKKMLLDAEARGDFLGLLIVWEDEVFIEIPSCIMPLLSPSEFMSQSPNESFSMSYGKYNSGSYLYDFST